MKNDLVGKYIYDMTDYVNSPELAGGEIVGTAGDLYLVQWFTTVCNEKIEAQVPINLMTLQELAQKLDGCEDTHGYERGKYAFFATKDDLTNWIALMQADAEDHRKTAVPMAAE